jgi:hypothetical protein
LNSIGDVFYNAILKGGSMGDDDVKQLEEEEMKRLEEDEAARLELRIVKGEEKTCSIRLWKREAI